MRLNKSDVLYCLQHPRAYLSDSAAFIDLWFFSKVLNVGDLVGPYLLEKITGKRARKNILGVRRHYLAVGSIFTQATAHSIVWGAGFMRATERLHCRPLKVCLVRGALTKNKLPPEFSPALGDPALALPHFYTPTPAPSPSPANATRANTTRANAGRENTRQIGLVLHYTDAYLQALFASQPNVKIITVGQQVETFVDEIVACAFVFSSSLHGLIIADAYQVRNCWIRFDRCRRADDFKYHDYFSIFTTAVPQSPLIIDTANPVLLDNQTQLCRTRATHKHARTIINSFA